MKRLYLLFDLREGIPVSCCQNYVDPLTSKGNRSSFADTARRSRYYGNFIP